jgi:hypothetical protein
MKHVLALACLLGGCVEGLAPAEVGIGRVVGAYPGNVAAVLPPMTDERGNLFVVTGMPDSTGMPQPGTAHSGGARGRWSAGCKTGTGTRGSARGWIGAVAGRGWLWTATAIVELDVATGQCTTKLDTDPVSASDVIFLGVAPLVDWTVSGRFAVAIVTTGVESKPHLATIDLGLGLVRTSEPLAVTEVLAVGADRAQTQAGFLVRDGSGLRVLIARPHETTYESIAVAGTATARTLPGDLAIGDDGTIAAILGGDAIAVGTRAGLAISPATFTPHTIDRDDDGGLWLTGLAGTEPRIASLRAGMLDRSAPWSCATRIDQALDTGIVVIDERGGERVAARWRAHGATGASALLPTRSVPAYAVGSRAVLVADPPVDRGGIAYSQLAVVPVGVEFQ